jgi:hypothetical protein
MGRRRPSLRRRAAAGRGRCRQPLHLSGRGRAPGHRVRPPPCAKKACRDGLSQSIIKSSAALSTIQHEFKLQKKEGERAGLPKSRCRVAHTTSGRADAINKLERRAFASACCPPGKTRSTYPIAEPTSRAHCAAAPASPTSLARCTRHNERAARPRGRLRSTLPAIAPGLSRTAGGRGRPRPLCGTHTARDSGAPAADVPRCDQPPARHRLAPTCHAGPACAPGRPAGCGAPRSRPGEPS